MHEQIRKDVNPLVIYVAYRPNADVYLTNFFLSDSIVVTGKSPITNFSHYSAIDELIEQARAETIASVPLHRLGTCDDIADLATFLCSGAASFITGAVLVCAGGQSLNGPRRLEANVR